MVEYFCLCKLFLISGCSTPFLSTNTYEIKLLCICTSNFGCFCMNENTWDFMQNIFFNSSLQFWNSSFYTSKVRNSLLALGIQFQNYLLKVVGIHPTLPSKRVKLVFKFDEDFTEKMCKNCCRKVKAAYCIFGIAFPIPEVNSSL